MLPLWPHSALTSLQALRKQPEEQRQGRHCASGEEWEAFKFHHTLLIIPPRSLFSRQALRPGSSRSRAPQTPQEERSLSASLKGSEESFTSQKEKLKLHLLRLKAPGRRETGTVRPSGKHACVLRAGKHEVRQVLMRLSSSLIVTRVELEMEHLQV